MTHTWDPAADGVLRLPSGRLVRGRGLRRPLPEGPRPEFALYMLGRRPPEADWENRWVRWPDFWLPSDRAAAATALRAGGLGAGGRRLQRRQGPHRDRAGLHRRARRGAGRRGGGLRPRALRRARRRDALAAPVRRPLPADRRRAVLNGPAPVRPQGP